MKRKELTKMFMMISKWKKTFSLHGLYKNIPALQGLTLIYFISFCLHLSVTVINKTEL